MGLFDLAPELFQRVVHILVEDVGRDEAFQHRLVCKTFAAEILDNVIARQDLSTTFRGRGNWHFFMRYDGSIIYARRAILKDNAITFINDLTTAVLALEGSGSRSIREQYAYDICHAVSGINHPKPAIYHMTQAYTGSNFPVQKSIAAGAAAVGNISLLQGSTSCIADLFDGGDHWFFPNAMCAAVARGQTQVVQWMLQYIQNRGITNDRTCCGLGDSLRVAVRTHQTDIGHLILDYLFENLGVYPGEEIGYTVQECLREGSDLLTRVLAYRKVQDIEYVRMEVENGLAISIWEMDKFFRYGTRYGLHDLILGDVINPNKMGRHLPLDGAVHCYRQDLAHVLLKNGVDIDACSHDGEGHTALQYAMMRGFPPNIQFLLDNGAEDN